MSRRWDDPAIGITNRCTVGDLALSIRRTHSVPAVLAALIPDQAKPYLSSNQGLILIANLDGQQVGITLVRMEALTFSGEIEALGVLENYRQRGIGTALLLAVEQELKRSGCLLVTFVWEANDSFAPYLRKILQHQEWHEPQLFIRRYHFDVQAFHPRWYERNRPVPPEYELFPWHQITQQERQTVDHQLSAGTYPSSVYPFGHDEELIEPINSLGLRHQGVLVGWMITHRVNPDTIRYSHLYVRDDYRHRGISILLLTEAIRRQQASTVPLSTFEIRLSQIHKRWLRFVERRLAPFAQAISEKQMAWKDLRTREQRCESCD